MNTARIIRTGLLATVLLGGVGWAVLWLRHDNDRLRQRVVALQRQKRAAVEARADTLRERELITRAAAASPGDADAIRLECDRLRQKIAEHERSVEARREKFSRERSAVALGRDPRQGLVRMEHFQNVGAATPDAAFQTLLWAAMKGDQLTLTGLMAFDDPARTQVKAWIATLPEAARARYPTPEALAALLFSQVITGHEAARFEASLAGDLRHATVTLSFGNASAGLPLPLQLGPNGWQLAVTEALIPQFERVFRDVAGGAARPRRV